MYLAERIYLHIVFLKWLSGMCDTEENTGNETKERRTRKYF